MFLRLLIFLIILIFSGCGNKTPVIEQLEKRGEIFCLKGESKPFQGEIRSFYDSDRKMIKELQVFNDGKPDGSWITYGEDGEKVSETHYQQGVKDGPALRYDNQGREIFRQIFRKGVADKKTVLTKYHGDTDVKMSQVSYREGVKNGLEQEWFFNGVLKSRIPYKRGDIDGEMTGWFQNGQKAYSSMFKGGKRHGIYKIWNQAGKLEKQEYYRNDRLIKKK